LADDYLKELQAANNEGNSIPDTLSRASGPTVIEPIQPMSTAPDATASDQVMRRTGENIPAHNDTPDVPMRFVEKKRLDWAGKTCAYVLPALSFSTYRPSA
jgi:tRNA-dihydrouridine synthase 3